MIVDVYFIDFFDRIAILLEKVPCTIRIQLFVYLHQWRQWCAKGLLSGGGVVEEIYRLLGLQEFLGREVMSINP